MRTLRNSLLVLIWVCLLSSLCWAQISTSSITGVVEDPTGAVVAGAKVKAVNEATGAVSETTTTSAGTYSLPSLPPGNYTITVTMEGFRTSTSAHNVLTVGQVLVVNVKLEVGPVAQVVSVEATYQRLETTSAMVSDVVSRRELLDLPLNGRNPLNLIAFQPGLVQRTGGSAGSGTHVFGSRDRSHNVTIDGIDSNESSVPNPQSNLYRLNPDNVQEYRVVTHNATPEFGRNSGANVMIATRAGTNEYHGDLYWFHRNTALNANEWYNNVRGVTKPIMLMHQFGAEGGGPIKKNKTFFFGSWQGNRIFQTMPLAQSYGSPQTYTATLRAGIYRYFVPDPANPLVLDGVTITRNSFRLVDPKTGALRPGVVMCATPTSVGCIRTYNIFSSDPLGRGADSLMLAMLTSFPLPNAYEQAGEGLNTGGFAWNPPSRFQGPHFLARIDHKFNENNNLFARGIWSNWDTTLGDFLNARPSVYPGFPPEGEVRRATQSVAISFRHVFSPRLVNEFTTGFSRFAFTFPLVEANRTGTAPPPYGQDCFGGASLPLSTSPYCNTPHTQRAVSNIQFIDNLGYTRGAHNIRTGLNIRMYRHNDERGAPGGFNMSPTIFFDRSIRDPGFPVAPNINSSDDINRLNLITEIMGIPARVQQAYTADFTHNVYLTDLWRAATRIKQFNFYVQDEWKVTRNLTMTYGLRWEINLPPSDSGDRVFVPDRPVNGSQGPVSYVRADRWYKSNNLTAFAPRLGLAWAPRGSTKTVIRAGWGIAFDTISSFQVTSIAGKVPGSAFQCRVQVQDSAAANPSCRDIPNDIRLSALMQAISPFTLGTPAITPSAALSPPARPFLTAPNVGAFQPDLKLPTVHEWSLTIQRELPWSFVGQIGYIGKRGIRLLRAYDLNQIHTDQPGFLTDFLRAQSNLAICQANSTACLAAQAAAGVSSANRTTLNFANFGLPGQVALPLLTPLIGATSLTSSAYRGSNATDVDRNGLGDLARRIDQADITARGFPANYFRDNPQFSELFYIDSGGGSSYHGMFIQLRRRFEKGLEFGFSYTLSKSFDDMSVDPVAATSGGGLSSTNSRTPTDIHNFRLDRTISDFDNTHVITSHYVYELPFGRGRKWGSNWAGVVNHFLGGWAMTGIFTYQSGEPYTVQSGVRSANGYKVARVDVMGPMPSTDLRPASGGPVFFTVSDISATVHNCRDVLNPDGSFSGSRFCFAAPGTSGIQRNAFRGPTFKNFDFGLIKNFAVTERVKLQFRTEVFNFFNHPNFENPRNASVGSPTLTSTVFGQACCVTSSLPSSATIIATGEPNRVIQFAMKLTF